jgi:hypothetical protein
MVTNERPIVLVDVTAKWAVDAAFFLATSAGFLLWGVVDRSPARNILSWAIMATVAMLFDRVRPLLHAPVSLAKARERPPDDAVRRTPLRYAAWAAGAMAALVVVQAAFVVYLAPPGFFAGWATAYCVSSLRALAAARAIERESGVRLSMSLHRAAWRSRPPAYYATPQPA